MRYDDAVFVSIIEKNVINIILIGKVELSMYDY